MQRSEMIEMLDNNIQYYSAKLVLAPTTAEKTRQQLAHLYAQRRALSSVIFASKPGLRAQLA